MSAEKSSQINTSLLDDFFTEADEHLLRIRQGLGALEHSVGKAQPAPQVVEDLFRHCHSFKGISAIVGLAPAEAVAHATEDLLRLMKSGRAALTKSALDVLVSAVQKLEQTVAAFRAKAPLPGYESVLARLRTECGLSSSQIETPPVPTVDTSPAENDASSILESAKARGLLLWRYTFSPSRELNAKGINVDAIRQEILKHGEILKSTPLIKKPGVVSFEFLVAAAQAPANMADWEAKGVVVQLSEQTEGNPQAGSPSVAVEEETHNPFLTPSHVVRVDLKRLDDLMRIVGEMVIHRSRLDTQLSQLLKSRVDVRSVQEVSNSLTRSLRELREAIMRVRMVPVSEIFARMPFVVKDLARQTQKKVQLKLEGQDTAVDKYLIERLKDPLLHLVRNAFSHGVETSEERLRASKPEEATIVLSASTVSDSVVISVRDDGRGINPSAIVERAKKMGLEIPEQIDNDALLAIICTSGFSTRDDVDRASGRGIGMAVVHSTVRELGGTLSFQTEEGLGTEFTLRLPLTLAIAETLIFSSAGQVCAIAQNFILELRHQEQSEVRIADGVEVVPYRSGVLPVIRLEDLFHLKRSETKKLTMLVIASERGMVGLLVEKVIGQREVVVGALKDPLIQVSGISGATELGDGKPVLILDCVALTRGNVRPPEHFSMDAKQKID